ncbi:GNAT family N-acetyltransferase [Maridesulfovibrio sp.]|uniref:GNAT family N-acetyltransferase n=1 Tax=Maridesulfovibrio sp. TaxID=2795000 RepID=UPI003BA8EBD9
MNSFLYNNRSIKTFTFNTVKDLEPFLDQWSTLSTREGFAPSFDPNWLLSWWDSYADTKFQLLVYMTFANNQLICVLPLMTKRLNHKTILSFLTDSCSDYLGPCFTSSGIKHVTPLLERAITQTHWDKCNFSNLSKENPAFHSITKLAQKHSLRVTTSKGSPIKKTILTNSCIQSFKERSRCNEYAYKKRKLSRMGDLKFIICEQYNKTLLNELCLIHTANWCKRTQTPQFADPRRVHFLKEITKIFSNTGELTIFCLTLNNIILSYRYGLIRNSIYYDWNTSYDTTNRKLSPGNVLLQEIIQHLIDSEITIFDFMRGNETYKDYWCNYRENLYNLEITR